MGIKEVIKDWLPPAVLRNVRKGHRFLKNGQPVSPAGLPEWEFVPDGWEAGRGAVGGWDQPGVADAYARKWPEFLERVAGTEPLGANHEAYRPVNDCFDTHNQAVTLGYVAGRAARHLDRLDVFDYGGALGHHLVLLKALFPELKFRYVCREVPHVAARGRALHPEVEFLADDSWKDRDFDLVIASNSIQYVRPWRELLTDLARVARLSVLLTKVPVAFRAPSFVVLQRAWVHGYGTEYLGWCLNREEFLAAGAANGLRFRREFLVFAHSPAVPGAPENPSYRGFLFDKGPGRHETDRSRD